MGRATLGRIMNVIGEPIDERGDISKILNPFYDSMCSLEMS